ncbi:helix-turn-helix domain-containing protein [Paenarthrobacter sp. NPDC056912]|uniref:helix-turn-helix domain-containing protein n=1 Tax=Paenarthrobacter sp. NPDC056912 TaxID=3345965 RepID=UPI003671DD76
MAITYSPEVERILTKATATVDELAVLLGIGRRQAYEAVQRGDIPSIRLGNRILISTRVINQMLDTGTVTTQVA